MTDFKPKKGDTILVRQEHSHLGQEREFEVFSGGDYHCKPLPATSSRYLTPWAYASPVPDRPQPAPFTQKTWPKQVVWVRRRDTNYTRMVVGINPTSVELKCHYHLYIELFNYYEMSLDHCSTWQPCHYVLEN